MRASDRGRVGEGVGKITYPRDKAHRLCNQVVSHRHPTLMVTLNTLPLTHPQPSTMCNGSMSGRIQNSISCWCLNGKNYSMDGTKLGGLQGKPVGKSSYRANVNQQLSYDTLHLNDASVSSMYLELMY
jgi:hypothetical protein